MYRGPPEKQTDQQEDVEYDTSPEHSEEELEPDEAYNQLSEDAKVLEFDESQPDHDIRAQTRPHHSILDFPGRYMQQLSSPMQTTSTIPKYSTNVSNVYPTGGTNSPIPVGHMDVSSLDSQLPFNANPHQQGMSNIIGGNPQGINRGSQWYPANISNLNPSPLPIYTQPTPFYAQMGSYPIKYTSMHPSMQEPSAYYSNLYHQQQIQRIQMDYYKEISSSQQTNVNANDNTNVNEMTNANTPPLVSNTASSNVSSPPPTPLAPKLASGKARSYSCFVLLEQPSTRQRKSVVKNEVRYLTPNPLIIKPRDPQVGQRQPPISDGTVTVSLLNKNSVELADSTFDTSDKVKSKPLDEELSAKFSIKINDVSEGNTFKLQFTVNYNVEGYGSCEEKILSHGFTMYNNRRKTYVEQSKFTDFKPKEGPTTSQTEVWIKGKGFTDDVTVMFGEQPGQVVEVVDNLITVFSPVRLDITEETQVVVVVSSKLQNDLSQGNRFIFTYHPPNSTSSEKKPEKEQREFKKQAIEKS